MMSCWFRVHHARMLGCWYSIDPVLLQCNAGCTHRKHLQTHKQTVNTEDWFDSHKSPGGFSYGEWLAKHVSRAPPPCSRFQNCGFSRGFSGPYINS